MRLRNWLIFLPIVLIWGANWSVMKRGLGFVPPTIFVLHRLMFSAIALSPALIFLQKRIPRDTDTWGKLLILGLINASAIVSTHKGLVGESSGIGAVLTYTQPLFVFCLAVPFLKEKITVVKLLGAVIGFLGVVVLFLNRLHSFTLNSTLLLLLGAFLWSTTVVYYKRFLNHVDSIVTNFFQLSIGVLPLAILSLITDSFILPRETEYFGIVLYASVGAWAIGWTLWIFLLGEEDANVISGSSFLVPVIALIFGWQLLGESLYVESLIGSALILVGVYLVNWRSRRRDDLYA